jgi:Protein of unknown function (DUF4232)
MPTTSVNSGSSTAGRRRRTLLAAAGVTLLAVAAAGCGNGGMSSTASQSSAPAGTTVPATPTTATPAPSTPPSTPPTATSGPPQSTPAPGGASPRTASDRCTVTELRMRLGTGDPGAGQIYYPLRFTNTSRHTCVLDGFPGVSLLRGDGSVIGKPAGREGSKGAAVHLAPNATVEADLHTLNRGIKGDSCWRTPTLLMAYPPGSKDAMTLTTSSPVICGGTFDVGTIH